MKTYWVRVMAAVVGCGILLGLPGCARDRDLALIEQFKPVYAPLPPEFLTGPIGRLLARQAGFSARVEAVGEPTTTSRAMTGQLFGANQTLVFAPDPDPEIHKAAPEEIFTFIWNTATGSGFVLNEALQGYAPVTFSSLADTNASGSEAGLRITRADMQGNFPSLIETTNITLKLSRLRRAAPAPDLLSPPKSFTRYTSPEIMAQELAMRRHNFQKEDK